MALTKGIHCKIEKKTFLPIHFNAEQVHDATCNERKEIHDEEIVGRSQHRAFEIRQLTTMWVPTLKEAFVDNMKL